MILSKKSFFRFRFFSNFTIPDPKGCQIMFVNLKFNSNSIIMIRSFMENLFIYNFSYKFTIQMNDHLMDWNELFDDNISSVAGSH